MEYTGPEESGENTETPQPMHAIRSKFRRSESDAQQSSRCHERPAVGLMNIHEKSEGLSRSGKHRHVFLLPRRQTDLGRLEAGMQHRTSWTNCVIFSVVWSPELGYPVYFALLLFSVSSSLSV